MSDQKQVIDQLANEIQKGIVKAGASIFVSLLIFYAVVSVVVGFANTFIATQTDIGRDSTDPAGGRSGMLVRTDALSGCQYLESAKGGLTPRLDVSGRQKCAGEGR